MISKTRDLAIDLMVDRMARDGGTMRFRTKAEDDKLVTRDDYLNRMSVVPGYFSTKVVAGQTTVIVFDTPNFLGRLAFKHFQRLSEKNSTFNEKVYGSVNFPNERYGYILLS